MKKEIVEVKDGVKRITTLNERFYAKPSKNPITGLPEYKYYPSSTWICGYYPKGIAFYQWLAKHGWDEAEAIKSAAGDKGSKVHYASEDIDAGKVIKIDDKYLNPSTEQEEELVPAELDCLIAFRDWLDKTNPELLASEISEFNEKYGYAGTIDRIYRIDGQIWIVDLKTSQYIWPEHELQISSYSNLDIDYKKAGITEKEWANKKLAILQIGYRRNKNKYKFTEVQDKFSLFLNAKAVWANENKNAEPKEIEYPLSIQSKVRAGELKKEKENVKNKRTIRKS